MSKWNSSNPLPVVVVGVGHLGKEHARVYNEMSNVKLLGVVDSQPGRAQEIGDGLSVPGFERIEPHILDLAAAASVVTPTPSHLEVARQFIDAGVSVLVEKPLASNVADASELTRLAEKAGVTLQVGHIERFNPVVLAAYPHIKKPVFIECDRIHPFSFRSVDVSVVMDLMIHDIDLVLNLVNAPVASLDAVGARVLAETEDLASARITFENGCVAMVKASRVGIQRTRKMRIFCANNYISLDHIAKTGMCIRLKDGFDRNSIDFKEMAQLEEKQGNFPIFTKYFNIQQLSIPTEEPLRNELDSFIEAVREGTEPVVTGQHGLQAIDIAMRITEDIRRNQATYARRSQHYREESVQEAPRH